MALAAEDAPDFWPVNTRLFRYSLFPISEETAARPLKRPRIESVSMLERAGAAWQTEEARGRTCKGDLQSVGCRITQAFKTDAHIKKWQSLVTAVGPDAAVEHVEVAVHS